MTHPGPVRLTLHAEGAATAALCVILYAQTGADWRLFALLILAPDLAMLGYIGGTRAGAVAYNAAHSYLAPLALAALGWAVGWPALLPLALVWGAHIGADRALGYGLKYATGFRDTHLARA